LLFFQYTQKQKRKKPRFQKNKKKKKKKKNPFQKFLKIKKKKNVRNSKQQISYIKMKIFDFIFLNCELAQLSVQLSQSRVVVKKEGLWV